MHLPTTTAAIIAAALVLAVVVFSSSSSLSSGVRAESQCQKAIDSQLPSNYIVYHTHGSNPVIDGHVLDDPVWNEVAWSEPFTNLTTGAAVPLITKFKARYCDKFLYIAGFISEPNIWSNLTMPCCTGKSQDSHGKPYEGPDFEFIVDPNGSCRNVKQVEVNPAGAEWNLLVNKPYHDGGSINSSTNLGPLGFNMFPPGKSAVFVKGAVNDPSKNGPGAYWTVEMALPISQLLEGSTSDFTNNPPMTGDLWRALFLRYQYDVIVDNNKYYRVPGSDPQFWSNSPMKDVDAFSPDLYPFLQFSTEPVNTSDRFVDPAWGLRFTGSEVYWAQKAYKKKHGTYTSKVSDLLPFTKFPSVLAGECTTVSIRFTTTAAGSGADGGGGGWLATITSHRLPFANLTVSDTRKFTINLLKSNPSDHETCTAIINNHYPTQDIYYSLSATAAAPPVIDGNLDDAAWKDVSWHNENDFVDISTGLPAALRTQIKTRFDDDNLYIAAKISENYDWANITSVCRCVNPNQDQLLYHGLSFDILVDADGDGQNLHQLEINPAGATLSLIVESSYDEGGWFTSCINKQGGFDFLPESKVAVKLTPDGAVLNDPSSQMLGHNTGWQVEVSIPWSKFRVNFDYTTNTKIVTPPREGDLWRVLFLRYEYGSRVASNNKFWLAPSCTTCLVPGSPVPDVWANSKLYSTSAMHPDRWGIAQFTYSIFFSNHLRYPGWSERFFASVLLADQYAYRAKYGAFTSNVAALKEVTMLPSLYSGTCTQLPVINTTVDATKYFQARICSAGTSVGWCVTVNEKRRIVETAYFQQFSGGGDNAGAVAALVIGILVLVACLGYALHYFAFSRNAKRFLASRRSALSENDIQEQQQQGPTVGTYNTL